MKAIAKVLIPVSFAFGAFAVQAGELPAYGGSNVSAPVAAQSAPSFVHSGTELGLIANDKATVSNVTRAEVRQQLRQRVMSDLYIA